MKLDALDHPKTLDLAARLNVELPTAIGYLELLWAFTAKKAPQGNIGKWPDGAIARSCYWNADATVFVTALADAGFLDRDEAHRYLIHDWKDHAPRWVASKLSRAGQAIIALQTDSTDTPINDCTDDSTRDSTGESVRHGKARVERGSTDSPHPATNANGSQHAKSQRPRGKRATKTSLPDDLVLDAELEAYVVKHLPDSDPARFMESFRGRAIAKGWQYANWRQAFMDQVRDAMPDSGHWSAGQYPRKPAAVNPFAGMR